MPHGVHDRAAASPIATSSLPETDEQQAYFAVAAIGPQGIARQSSGTGGIARRFEDGPSQEALRYGKGALTGVGQQI